MVVSLLRCVCVTVWVCRAAALVPGPPTAGPGLNFAGTRWPPLGVALVGLVADSLIRERRDLDSSDSEAGDSAREIR